VNEPGKRPKREQQPGADGVNLEDQGRVGDGPCVPRADTSLAVVFPPSNVIALRGRV